MSLTSGQRVLLTDDQEKVLHNFRAVLESRGYLVSIARDGNEALKVLEAEPIDLVVADLQMPVMDGLELTRRVVVDWPDVPVLMLTGHGTVEMAVLAMKEGAADFLVKPLDPEALLIKISRVLEEKTLRQQNTALSLRVQEQGGYGEIVGSSQEMVEVYDIIGKLAAKPTIALISGESGTGKELIARAIHRKTVELKQEELGSAFKEHDFPYVGVNCGAFSRTLLESQLFGHKRGSFSGAIADQAGVFAAAGQGTLFLDEISELDIDLQVRLLRALQEREVTPIGSTQPIPVHARILTATNKDLEEQVRLGKFRQDLYYRVKVVSIELPPLRDRAEDIPQLVDYFLASTANEFRMAPLRISTGALAALVSYPWQGNVRELRNVMENMFVLSDNDKEIGVADLPPEIRTFQRGRPEPVKNVLTYDQAVGNLVADALVASAGNKSKAAALLGIDRNRLYRMITRYGLLGSK